MNADHDVPIRHNPGSNKFEATVEGHTAFVDYKRTGDTIWFTHTEVPKELEGRGIGSALAKHVLDYAQTSKLKVVPSCPFIADYITAHPAYAPLVTGSRPK